MRCKRKCFAHHFALDLAVGIAERKPKRVAQRKPFRVAVCFTYAGPERKPQLESIGVPFRIAIDRQPERESIGVPFTVAVDLAEQKPEREPVRITFATSFGSANYEPHHESVDVAQRAVGKPEHKSLWRAQRESIDGALSGAKREPKHKSFGRAVLVADFVADEERGLRAPVEPALRRASAWSGFGTHLLSERVDGGVERVL